MVAFLRLRKGKNMQTRNDKGEPLLACDFTVMDTEQRRRYGVLRRRLSKDLHEARELEHSPAFRHSSEAEMLIAMAEYITLERLCCPFCQEWVSAKSGSAQAAGPGWCDDLGWWGADPSAGDCVALQGPRPY